MIIFQPQKITTATYGNYGDSNMFPSEREKHCIEGNILKVNEPFKQTEAADTAVSGETPMKTADVRPVGRPKKEAVKVKSFALPVGLNQRLRRFAFEQERSEVDVVRAALEAYLDAQEGK